MVPWLQQRMTMRSPLQRLRRIPSLEELKSAPHCKSISAYKPLVKQESLSLMHKRKDTLPPHCLP